ncbi:phospholipase D-like domain-containing protein [Pseudomonas sp. SA3-5]|uniref:Phospholipase D-like domain-containing protein n=1 Tax=Pseudomonas aestuarii TaxID=3018340 RepID=A0ABT4XFA7_9PSED|nr:phospholipase D-like domain-containing protein [Pseudomonas aestuarii]MDA7086905.1 phospholipase D-like domain-containing protein [Pseudomonas aestuarii]
MATNPAYNGVREKELNQINTQDGKACVAYSAPDFFINGQDLFAPKRTGNNVRFFTTGEDYFKDVAAAIDQASSSVFITGWQVNYDVLLDGKRSLWQCLHQALKKKPALKVYVMPWLSSAGSLGTYDFETMLAIFQLNAGLSAGPRAFCTPAIQQSDMKGLGVAFSHHQKSVVIDNRIGYVGGIDLAYGRRDDNNFSLDASKRQGNDAYNPGLPKLGWMDMDKHVSSMGLMMATLFDLSKPVTGSGVIPLSTSTALNGATYIADLFRSPPHAVLQGLIRAKNSAMENLDEGFERLSAAQRQMVGTSIRAMAKLIDDNLNNLPMAEELRLQLQDWLRELEAAGRNLYESLRIKSIELISQWMSQTDLGRVLTVLSGKSFDDIPGAYRESTNELASSMLWFIYHLLQERSGQHLQPYPYLHETPQPLASPDNGRLADDQPRMPWQDVHSRIEGPSVYDLARNFIDRWNGQQAYLAQTPPLQDTTLVRNLLEAVVRWLNDLSSETGLDRLGFGIKVSDSPRLSFPKPQPVWINTPDQLPEAPATKPGGMSVQVLRSAASRMTQQEQEGRSKAGVNLPLPPGIDTGGVQANCKEAMLQAISSAQHFIYIENQFFQSAYGNEGELNPLVPLSGPMASLRDPSSLRQDFVARVRLREALKAKDIWQLDWKEIDAIAQEPSMEARQFLKSLKAMWSINTQGWLTHKLGETQSGLLNDIGEALANRIGRAIDEKLPFHVYMILPVHPEGALNVLNIMHQVSLTMQSLAFGEHSLIKRIQRRMALRELLDRKVSREDALKVIERLDSSDRPVYEQQDWTRYLTLLNLRTWETLNGRVVTEQIYVHSKLLIADDRVAILGSANINDRSLQGSRDSELAVIVRDSTPAQAKLDGKCLHTVGKAVQQLRMDLWKKHFGLAITQPSGVSPAAGLAQYLEQPAAEQTWRAIQERAQANTDFYNESFDFIPQNISQVQPRKTPDLKEFKTTGFPTSTWPSWAYSDLANLDRGGELMEPMPHEERFWRSNTLAAVKSFAPPVGVQGFICALPTNWTRGENNDSGINLTILAQLFEQSDQTLAHSDGMHTEGTRRT